MSEPGNPPVDFVIMWVDGSDPETARARNDAIAQERAAGFNVNDTPNRHRDNGELLFLLRSIQAHMPWYRQIILVTNGQRPSYIDFSSAAIRQVSQAEIFPSDSRTPSFNSRAVDCCISSVEGLSENYVRFADDFLVGSPVAKGTFLGQDGLGRHLVGSTVFNVGSSPYLENLQNNAVQFWRTFQYLPVSNFLHVPQLRRRTTVRQMEAAWPEWFSSTRSSRFRHTDDLALMFLYPYFSLFQNRRSDLTLLATGKPSPGIVDVNRLSNIHKVYTQVRVGEKADWRAALNRISREPPMFFNINDDFGVDPSEKDRRYVGQQLYRLFPKASPFETRPELFPGYAATGA